MRMNSTSVWFFFNVGFLVGIFTAILYFEHLTSVSESLHTEANHEQRVISNTRKCNATEPIRILCMILTMPSNHASKASAAKRTWASRCDDYYFISSQNDPKLPSLAAVNMESRDHLWDKTKFAIWWAVNEYDKPFDYFFKCDDDTYVVMENLREILQSQNKSKPFLMGRRFRPFVEQGYPSGGAGYVISRPGLEKMAQCLSSENRCGTYNYTLPEDVGFGICAQNAGIPFADSVDEDGYERFHPFPYYDMLMQDGKTGWLSTYNYYALNMGKNCCSNQSISFHYMNPTDMFTFDFLLYHMRPKQ